MILLLLKSFFCTLIRSLSSILFPQKNAHKNATGFETKREHWYHLGLVFCSMLLSFICCYYGITSVFKAMQCLFYCKKVWCSAKLRYYFFVCVCCVLHCPPHPSVRPDKKKFLCLCPPLPNVVILWVDEDSLSCPKRHERRGKDASRVYVALCHLISEAEAGSYCALLFLKLSARTREPSMVPFLWGPRLKRLPPKKQHWRPNCE